MTHDEHDVREAGAAGAGLPGRHSLDARGTAGATGDGQ